MAEAAVIVTGREASLASINGRCGQSAFLTSGKAGGECCDELHGQEWQKLDCSLLRQCRLFVGKVTR